MLLLQMLFLFAIPAFADTYIRQPSIDALHYDISVEVTDSSDSIRGTAKIRIQIRNRPAEGMWLDLQDMSVDKLIVDGNERRFTCSRGRLKFQFGRIYSPNEILQAEIRYHGKPRKGLLFAKNRHGRRVVFADNWPDAAHHWFPSVDHPSDKATVSFAVTAPQKYDVIANGLAGKVVPLPNGRKITEWHEYKAIPTYCMVIGIAEFAVSHPGDGAVPLAWYAYPQDAESAASKFRRTADILTFFEHLIGPYPYEKLAQVESGIRLGAMENASAIFYSESYFVGNTITEEPVAHEIAHQWFGDSVTESDWDHLWLSEGFATYFEALFYEHLGGPEALKAVMDRHARKIMAYEPARNEPVVDPNQADPSLKLTPLNYEKGAWVLHMLRGILGDETFFNGIRRYYTLYAGGNASTEDFRRVMETVSGIDLSRFFKQWLYGPAWPDLRMSWQWDEPAHEVEISVRQDQSRQLFDIPLEIQFLFNGRTLTQKFRIKDARNTFRIPLQARPDRVLLDPGNWVLKSAPQK